jgi:hypothetical protein
MVPFSDADSGYISGSSRPILTITLYTLAEPGTVRRPMLNLHFGGIGQHVDPNPNSKSNALARNLRNLEIEPEECNFQFTAIGPIFDECENMESHVPVRDQMAALERRTADWFREQGFDVIGTHPRPRDVNAEIWNQLEAELTQRFHLQSGV